MPRYKEPFTLFKRKGQKAYYYRLGSDPARTARTTGKALKHEARAFVEHLLANGGGTVPTFAEYASDFFEWDGAYLSRRRAQGKRKQLSEGSAASRQGHLRNWLLPKWGKRRLDQIPLAEFEDWLHGLRLSAQSKNHIMYSMSLIMKEAVRRGVLMANPLSGMEALDTSEARKRDILSEEELGRLFPRGMAEFLEVWPTATWHDFPPINYGVMFAVAVSGGLRSGELVALRWKHISWVHGGVAVVAAKKFGGVEGAPKWSKTRAVLLPKRTMELLAWWRDQVQPHDLEEHVFPDRNRRSLVLALRAGFKRAGIDTSGRYLDVHALRHTFNSHMRNLVEDEKLRAFTGHSSERLTEHYDHTAVIDRLPRLADQRENVDRFPI